MLVDAGDGLGRWVSAARRQHEHDLRWDLRALPRREARRSAPRRALFGYSGVYPRLDGGQAELVRIPRADRCLWPVPDAVSERTRCSSPTSCRPLSRGAARVMGLGDVVAVLGCGPVGLMAVLCAVGAIA